MKQDFEKLRYHLEQVEEHVAEVYNLIEYMESVIDEDYEWVDVDDEDDEYEWVDVDDEEDWD